MATSTENKTADRATGLPLDDADDELRAQLIAGIRRLHSAKVAPFSVMSNGSVRLPSGEGILVSAGQLRPDIGPADFGIVDLDGQVIRGELGPNVGPAVSFHLEVYRAHPEIDTVLHTHSPAATSFAVANKSLPLHYEPLLFLGQREDIPVTTYGNRNQGSSLSDEVAATLAQNPGTKAILLANHGLLTWGSGPVRTAEFLIAVEEAATIIIGAAALGGSKPFAIA